MGKKKTLGECGSWLCLFEVVRAFEVVAWAEVFEVDAEETGFFVSPVCEVFLPLGYVLVLG